MLRKMSLLVAEDEDVNAVANEFLRPLQSQLSVLHTQRLLDAFGLYM